MVSWKNEAAKKMVLLNVAKQKKNDSVLNFSLDNWTYGTSVSLYQHK